LPSLTLAASQGEQPRLNVIYLTEPGDVGGRHDEGVRERVSSDIPVAEHEAQVAIEPGPEGLDQTGDRFWVPAPEPVREVVV
jgi:hypothetical protein